MGVCIRKIGLQQASHQLSHPGPSCSTGWERKACPNPLLLSSGKRAGHKDKCLSYVDVCTMSTGLISIFQLADCTFLWGQVVVTSTALIGGALGVLDL